MQALEGVRRARGRRASGSRGVLSRAHGRADDVGMRRQRPAWQNSVDTLKDHWVSKGFAGACASAGLFER
eukprot:9492312-Pyramimonas_sp.AAC.1